MAVSKRTRFEVLRRDNHVCRYCGAKAPDVTLTVDHVIPVALGGSDKPDNLVAACRDCNYGKASTSPDGTLVDDVKQDAIRWSKAMKRAAEQMASDRAAESAYLGAFHDKWLELGMRLDHAEPTSLERLYRAGLPVEEMLYSILVAATQPGVTNRFSYCMGVCWKRLAMQHELATGLATDEAGD